MNKTKVCENCGSEILENETKLCEGCKDILCKRCYSDGEGYCKDCLQELHE